MPTPVTRAQLAPLFSSSPPSPGSPIWDAPLSPWLRRPDTLAAGLSALASEVEVRWERNLVVPLEKTLLVSEADVDWFLTEAREHRASNKNAAGDLPPTFSADSCRELAVRYGPARRLTLLEYRFTEVLRELQSPTSQGGHQVAITDAFFCIELIRPCEPHREGGSGSVVCTCSRISDLVLMADVPSWWAPYLPLVDEMDKVKSMHAIEDGKATPDRPEQEPRQHSEQPSSGTNQATTSSSTAEGRRGEEPATKRQRLLEHPVAYVERPAVNGAVGSGKPVDEEASAAPSSGASPSGNPGSQPAETMVSNNEDPNPSVKMEVKALNRGAYSGSILEQSQVSLGQASLVSPVPTAVQQNGTPSTLPVEAAREKSGPPLASTPLVKAAREKSGPPLASTPLVKAAREKSGPPLASTPPVQAAREKSGPPLASTPPVQAAREKSGPPLASTPPVQAAREKSGPPLASTPPVQAAREKSGPPLASTPPVQAAREKSGPPLASTPPVQAAREKGGPPLASTPPVKAAREKSGPPLASTPPVKAAREKSGPPLASTPPVQAAREKSGPPWASTPPVKAAREKSGPPLASTPPVQAAREKSGPPWASTPPVKAAREKSGPPFASHTAPRTVGWFPQVPRRTAPSGAVASKAHPPKRQEGHTKPTAAKASSRTPSSRRRAPPPPPPSTTPPKAPNAIAAALSGTLSHSNARPSINDARPSTIHYNSNPRPSLNANTRSPRQAPPAASPTFSDSVIPRRAHSRTPDRGGQQEAPYRSPSLRPRTFSNPGPQGSSRYTFKSPTPQTTAPQFHSGLAGDGVPGIAVPSFYSEQSRRGLPVLRPKEEYRANWPPPPHRGRSGAIEIPCKFIPNRPPADRS